MKAKTRMIVASAVVIAFALTAVSGITYSWFSDTEETKINVSTAKIDYEVTYTAEANSSIGTTATVTTDGIISIDKLAAGAYVSINADIVNKSTIKTVYKITAIPTIEANSDFTYYDLINVYIDGVALKVGNLGEELIVKDWTVTDAGINPEKQTITITTPNDYGGAPGAEIKSFKTDTGEGSVDGATEGYTAWSQTEEKSGLTIKLSIVAMQGDYPYTPMSVDGNIASVDSLPDNKVVKAEKIEVSSGVEVEDVVVDFSNVTSYGTTEGTTTGTDITNQKVELQVKSVESASAKSDGGKVELSLNLGTESTETPKYFDKPVVITMTVPGKFTNPVIVYNAGEGKTGENGTVISSVISGNSTTITFSVTHFSDYTIQNVTGVSTAENLKAVLEKGVYVKLTADIDNVSDSITLPADGNKVELDLNGHNIKFSNTAGFVNLDKLEVIGADAYVTDDDGKNGTFYETLGEALASGGTTSDNKTTFSGNITLLRDVELTENIAVYYFSGILDGNGHTIVWKEEFDCGEYYSIIARHIDTNSKATVKNLKYKMLEGEVRSLFMSSRSDLTFENVEILETTASVGKNDSAFVANIAATGAVHFKNCISRANYYSDEGTSYSGVFVGGYLVPGAKASFDNCVNYGDMRMSGPGIYFGNANGMAVSSNADTFVNSITISNCINYGTIEYTSFGPYVGGNGNEVCGVTNILQNGTTNYGSFVYLHDESMKLTKDSNTGTISITKASNESVDSYKVSYTVWANIAGGGTLSTTASLAVNPDSEYTVKEYTLIDKTSFTTKYSEKSFSETWTVDDYGGYKYQIVDDFIVIDYSEITWFTLTVESKPVPKLCAYDSDEKLLATVAMTVAAAS